MSYLDMTTEGDFLFDYFEKKKSQMLRLSYFLHGIKSNTGHLLSYMMSERGRRLNVWLVWVMII